MVVVKQRILAAFLNRGEVLVQAQALAALGDAKAKARFWEDYAVARTKLASIQPLPTGDPQFRPLPTEAQAHVARVEATDSFQESYGGFSYSFRSVPIDRISPLQTFCNLEPRMPPPESKNTAALLEYALPVDSAIPGEVMITGNGVRFSSPRYGMGLQHVHRRVEQGRVILTFEHPNLVQVRKFGNVLILANGTHRVMEMARDKRTHIPAIVIEHRSPAEFDLPQGQGFWNGQFLLANPRQPAQGARPPLVVDFLSDLSIECKVNVLPSVVDVSIGAPPASQPSGAQPIAIQLGGLIAQPGP
jgi:hypothetical protein